MTSRGFLLAFGLAFVAAFLVPGAPRP